MSGGSVGCGWVGRSGASSPSAGYNPPCSIPGLLLWTRGWICRRKKTGVEPIWVVGLRWAGPPPQIGGNVSKPFSRSRRTSRPPSPLSLSPSPNDPIAIQQRNWPQSWSSLFLWKQFPGTEARVVLRHLTRFSSLSPIFKTPSWSRYSCCVRYLPFLIPPPRLSSYTLSSQPWNQFPSFVLFSFFVGFLNIFEVAVVQNNMCDITSCM